MCVCVCVCVYLCVLVYTCVCWCMGIGEALFLSLLVSSFSQVRRYHVERQRMTEDIRTLTSANEVLSAQVQYSVYLYSEASLSGHH